MIMSYCHIFDNWFSTNTYYNTELYLIVLNYTHTELYNYSGCEVRLWITIWALDCPIKILLNTRLNQKLYYTVHFIIIHIIILCLLITSNYAK